MTEFKFILYTITFSSSNLKSPPTPIKYSIDLSGVNSRPGSIIPNINIMVSSQLASSGGIAWDMASIHHTCG